MEAKVSINGDIGQLSDSAQKFLEFIIKKIDKGRIESKPFKKVISDLEKKMHDKLSDEAIKEIADILKKQRRPKQNKRGNVIVISKPFEQVV